MALRVIVAAAVFGALYLLMVITQTLFSTIGEQTAKGQTLAAGPGHQRPHGWFRGSAAVGGYPRDPDLGLVPPDHRSMGGIYRRSVRHHPQYPVRVQDRGDPSIVSSAADRCPVVLLLLLIVTRIVQRWLETELLPRTRLEPSLQLSIVTIFGYIGAIMAIGLALTRAWLRPAEDHVHCRRPFGRYRVWPAVHRVEFRIRPYLADRTADPRRRLDRGQGRGGMGSARSCPRNRDRDF